MALYLVRGGEKPKFFSWWVHPVVMVIGVLFPPILYFLRERNETIEFPRRTWFTIPKVLGWFGALGAFFVYFLGQYYYGSEAVYYNLFAAACAAMILVSWWLAARRPQRVAIPSQSLRTPRNEILVDSWHVSVPQAGDDFNKFKPRLFSAISSLDPNIEINKEMHQKLSPRGFEERERYVLTKGQANLHVHIYQFGHEAFVGWDGYLNFAKWQETEPVSVNIKNGTRVEHRSLTSGIHVPSEFDLMELNVLTELVHRAIVQEIKTFLKEKNIEADLDFQIIRGDRERALTAMDDGGHWSSKIKRSYFSGAKAGQYQKGLR